MMQIAENLIILVLLKLDFMLISGSFGIIQNFLLGETEGNFSVLVLVMGRSDNGIIQQVLPGR